jgi:hypothetical protein
LAVFKAEANFASDYQPQGAEFCSSSNTGITGIALCPRRNLLREISWEITGAASTESYSSERLYSDGDRERFDALHTWYGYRRCCIRAVHIAGWNLSFPTSVDQELWHISSILMTCLLPIACFPLIVIGVDWDLFDFLPFSGKTVGTMVQVWGFVFGMFYMLARLILLVETFRTLVFLPPDAFVSTWVSNTPNVS